MSMAQVAIALSGAGVLVTGWLALIFLRDPVAGLAQTTHRAENLPQVMTDRYIAFTGLALFATFYGDLKVIAALFSAFAFMGFADAFIYHRAGHPTVKHMAAGGASTLVFLVALFALRTEGGL